MGKVILTSFRDGSNWKGTHYSIARWAPTWTNYMQFPVKIAPYLHGKAIKNLVPDAYRLLYEEVLRYQADELKRFFLAQPSDSTAVLMCWCNPDRQKEYKKLFCHRILVGFWLEVNCPWIEVLYADGAENPIWER